MMEGRFTVSPVGANRAVVKGRKAGLALVMQKDSWKCHYGPLKKKRCSLKERTKEEGMDGVQLFL